jgi:hypothetical protein
MAPPLVVIGRRLAAAGPSILVPILEADRLACGGAGLARRIESQAPHSHSVMISSEAFDHR